MAEPTLPAATPGLADAGPDLVGGGRPGGALMAAGSDTVTATAGPPDALLFIGGGSAVTAPAGSVPGVPAGGDGPFRVGPVRSLSQPLGDMATPAGPAWLAAGGDTAGTGLMAGSGNVTLTAQPAIGLNEPTGAGLIFRSIDAAANALTIGIVSAGDEAPAGSGAWLAGVDAVGTAGMTMTLSDNTTITMADYTVGSQADGGGTAG